MENLFKLFRLIRAPRSLAPSAMIVQYASDLHLDYGQNYEYILNKGFEEEGNVLILAGDVANLVALRTYRLFWDLCSSNFERTIFVPGNHDYYGEWEKVEDLIEPIKIPIRPNVLLSLIHI